MKQKNYIIKLLLKTWLGILCFSLLCTFCAVWLLFQNTKQSSYDNINIAYEGILLTWAIIGVIMFSAGTITLFMNYFPVIRYNNIYRFLSFLRSLAYIRHKSWHACHYQWLLYIPIFRIIHPPTAFPQN